MKGLLYAGITISMAGILAGPVKYEYIRHYGTLVRLEITGRDPFHPTMGNYMAIQPATLLLPVAAGDTNPEYLCFGRSTPGLPEYVAAGNTGTCLQAASIYRQSEERKDKYHVQLKEYRFFVNEKRAPAWEKAVLDALAKSIPVYLEMRILDGAEVPVAISIAGTPLQP